MKSGWRHVVVEMPPPRARGTDNGLASMLARNQTEPEGGNAGCGKVGSSISPAAHCTVSRCTLTTETTARPERSPEVHPAAARRDGTVRLFSPRRNEPRRAGREDGRLLSRAVMRHAVKRQSSSLPNMRPCTPASAVVFGTLPARPLCRSTARVRRAWPSWPWFSCGSPNGSKGKRSGK